MKLLKNLLKTFAIVLVTSGCKLSSSPIAKHLPPPDVDICSMGMPKKSANAADIWIDCEPWFYEGRIGYEVDPVKAAQMKYFLIAPNHFRALQIWVESVDREVRSRK